MHAVVNADFRFRHWHFCWRHTSPILGVGGASGAGKTTLLNLLAGLKTPDSGHLEILGCCWHDSATGHSTPTPARGVGYAMQHMHLFPHISVQRNLTYGSASGRNPSSHPHFADTVDALELAPLLRRKPLQLSGGEKRRVALGRALLASPKLLLLDEPFSGLDTRLRAHAAELIRRTCAKASIPAIVVTHGLAELTALTTDMLLIDNGRVAGQGSIHQLAHGLNNWQRATELGLVNLLEVCIGESTAEQGITFATCAGQELALPYSPLASGTIARVRIAPDDLIVAREKPRTSARNALTGVVREIRPYASACLVDIDLGHELVVSAELTPAAVADLKLAPGANVFCLAKSRAFECFATAGDNPQ